MPKTMYANVAIDLPTDEFEEAATKVKIKPAFDAFLSALHDAGVTFAHELKTLETRAKPATAGARRGRKPRVKANSDGQPEMTTLRG